MRLFLLFAALTAAATLAACDSTPGATTCPDTGVVTVADSSIGTGQPASGGFTATYVGRLAADGSVFDQGTNVRFSNVIPGFRQGVTGRTATEDTPAIAPMRANGGRRLIFIPASFGYGAQGASDVIPSCADLIFDVTLIEP